MPPQRLSPELQQLIKKHPLASRAETDRVLRGDTELGLRRYAEQAQGEGPSGSSWSLYFGIQGELGRSFEDAVRGQSPAACESLARWGFEEGRETVAVLAFERFLEHGTSAPKAEDAARYVAVVEATDGPGAAGAARALVERRMGTTRPAEAKPPPAEAKPPPVAAKPAPPVAAKPTPVAAKPAPPVRAKAGFRPVVVEQLSAHSFAGFDLTMPGCGACGATIRCYFAFDVEAEPELSSLLPKWALLPFVGCDHCGAWRFRHDYQIDKDGTELSLLGVEADADQLFAVPRGEAPTLPRKNVSLAAASPSSPATAIQVAGDPLFLRVTLAPACPSCAAPMRYVGTLAEPFGFPVKLGLEGCRYHFACPGCRTLSVIAQW